MLYIEDLYTKCMHAHRFTNWMHACARDDWNLRLMFVSQPRAPATCWLVVLKSKSIKASCERASAETTRVKKTNPQKIGAEMGRKCRILHRNKKYKKDIKIQLVSQWVFSMSFKITKVKLLFLG